MHGPAGPHYNVAFSTISSFAFTSFEHSTFDYRYLAVLLDFFYRTMHYSAKCGIAIA